MQGNGFCWGQLSHTLAWIFHTTELIPLKVYAILGLSDKTNADIASSIIIQCHNFATISISSDALRSGDVKFIDNLIVGMLKLGRAHPDIPDGCLFFMSYHFILQ
jgi:hypothetical protein